MPNAESRMPKAESKREKLNAKRQTQNPFSARYKAAPKKGI
jgi:hypothetical protein